METERVQTIQNENKKKEKINLNDQTFNNQLHTEQNLLGTQSKR